MSILQNLNINNKMNIKNTQTFPTTINTAVKLLNYKSIAPAPSPVTAAATTTVVGVVKNRKYTPRASNNILSNSNNNRNSTTTTSTAPYGNEQTQSVQRRNARERNRVKQVNNSFARLRQHLPKDIIIDMTKGGGRGPHKKISKVDTLRIAVEYIRRLESFVENLGGSEVTSETTTATAQQQNYNMNSTTTTPDNFVQQQQQQHQQLPTQQPQYQLNSLLLTPITLAAFSTPLQTKIDTSCLSPTASYISNTSFDSGTYEPSMSQQLSPEPQSTTTTSSYTNDIALKFEPYDNFRLNEEDCTPDDEEIIDYISLWQEEQQATTTHH